MTELLHMTDLIERDEAIRKLTEIQASRAQRTCSPQAQREAAALGYAIEIVKRIPSYDQTDAKQ